MSKKIKYSIIDLPGVFDSKKAYPNQDFSNHSVNSYDIEKWIRTIKEIYNKETNGMDRRDAIINSTRGWKGTEIYSFLNWLKYYEEGSHMKYKFAQNWYEGEPGYYLHIKKDPEPQPIQKEDVNFVVDNLENDQHKKQIIIKQRQKILGRLDSLEKLIRSTEGQLFTGNEFESIIKAIFDLKTKINLVNKKSHSTRLYEDMIIRQGNVLNSYGFSKAASYLYSIAQETQLDNPALSVAPAPAPTQNVGNPGTLPASIETPQDTSNDTLPIGLAEFLKNLETNGLSEVDDLDVSDELSVDDLNLFSNAQIENSNSEIDQNIEADQPSTKLEQATETPSTKDFDAIIDAAFSNITTADIVNKLEDLAKIFKIRAVPKELYIVDIMLDTVGLGSLFPELSEAINKALDSNNYISTRIEDILSRLRGTLKTNEIDLTNEQEASPEFSNIKNKLQQDEQKEKERKDMKKELQNKELDEGLEVKETPEIEVQEDIGDVPTSTINSPTPITKSNPQINKPVV